MARYRMNILVALIGYFPAISICDSTKTISTILAMLFHTTSLMLVTTNEDA